MNHRILVKAYANEHGIDFRTVSRTQKSPHRFYILRDVFRRLEQEPHIIVHDIYSFAVLRRDSYRGTLEISFTWLRGSNKALSGWEEIVTLPYDELMAFVHDSAQEGGPKTWRALSMDVSKRRPKFVFQANNTFYLLRLFTTSANRCNHWVSVSPPLYLPTVWGDFSQDFTPNSPQALTPAPSPTWGAFFMPW